MCLALPLAPAFADSTSSANKALGPHPTTQDKQTVVILLGPPGSGKGTQAVRLSKALNLPHISTGDLFRYNISKGTELGKKAKEYMDAGKLVPDEIVLDMLFKRVAEADASKGYLLDGFPRTLTQAKALDKHLAEQQAKIMVFNLEVKDEVLSLKEEKHQMLREATTRLK